MKLPENTKEHLEILSISLTILVTVLALFKSVRTYIKNKFLNFFIDRKAKKEMPLVLSQIHTKVIDMDTRLKKVEYEIKDDNSGGTIKGSLKLIRAEIEATNWLTPRPTFRTTSKGMHMFVNEAYCQLCAATPDELLKLGWKSFVPDEEQADEYYDRWLLASKSLSQFASKLKIQSKYGEDRGEWTIRIRPLGPIESPSSNEIDYMWNGTLYPSNDIAKQYAKSMGIPL